MHGVSTTFFVTEFGYKWRANDLLYEFKKLGEVEEVVIPPKKDSKGRRYGFTHFLNVKDEKLLATKLDNIILDGRKLFANVPRFNRGNFGQLSAQPNYPKADNRSRVQGAVSGHSLRFCSGTTRLSYANALQNKKSAMDPKRYEDHAKSITFHPNPEDYCHYSKAYVGKIKNPGVIINFKKIFMEEGLFSIRVTSLGPNLCLLEDLVGGEIESFLEERKGWWEQWFTSFKPWEPKDIDAERFVWIKLRGIPCHA